MASASIRFAEPPAHSGLADPHHGRMDDLDAARGVGLGVLVALPLSSIILLLSTVLD
jgi:hypothetical protein